jgi:hypothetical protein
MAAAAIMAASSIAGWRQEDDSTITISSCKEEEPATLIPLPVHDDHFTVDDKEDALVDNYVKSLMKDHELVLLPLGMGKTSPILLDLFGLNKALVLEAISSFEWTVQEWNSICYQGKIVGHPIVYEYDDDDGGESETHSMRDGHQQPSSTGSHQRKKINNPLPC